MSNPEPRKPKEVKEGPMRSSITSELDWIKFTGVLKDVFFHTHQSQLLTNTFGSFSVWFHKAHYYLNQKKSERRLMGVYS